MPDPVVQEPDASAPTTTDAEIAEVDTAKTEPEVVEDAAPVEIAAPTRRVKHKWAVAGLTVFALAFYWRITQHIGGDMWPSDMQDGASFTWNFWYLSTRVLSGHDPFITHDIFYPAGAPLGFHTYVPLMSLLSWPLFKLFGMATAFTIITLLGPILSGIGAYFLAYHLTRNRWASFFAGAAYIMLPDRALRMAGHVNLNQTFMLPIALLFLLKFYEKPTKRNAALLGVSLGASLLVESIFTAFLIIAALVVVIWKWRTTFQFRVIRGWVVGGIVALVVASPVLLAMVRDLKNDQLDPLPGWGGAEGGSADLLSYFVPSQFNPVTGTWLGDLYGRVTAGEKFTFVGWTTLLLAFVALFKWRNEWKKALIAMTLTFFVLSLGPVLHVANKTGHHFEYLGQKFDVPLPYVAIHFIPVFNGVRIPARFALMTDLLVAVLAAGGLAWIASKLSRDGARKFVSPVVCVVALAALTVECLPGNVPGLTNPKIPAPYTAIANDPGNRAVMEIPIQWRDGFGRIGDDIAARDDTVFMYYATEHGKPLVGGMTARYPDAKEIALKSIPIYAQVLGMQGDLDPVPVTFTVKDLQALGIGYIVAHRDRPMPKVYDYVTNLFLPVLADDGTTIVWRVPPPA